MSRAAGLLVLGVAGYYAYHQGWLDEVIGQGRDLIQQESADVPVSLPTTPAKPVSAPLTPAPTNGTKEEKILWANERYLSAWSKRNILFTASIMHIESRGNPSAISNAGALGLMQVMPATGKWLHDDLGYNELPATRASLLTPHGSVYFGTAYLEWADSIRGSKSLEWFIRSYNGGAKGAEDIMSGKKQSAENDNYYKIVLAYWQRLKSKGVTA